MNTIQLITIEGNTGRFQSMGVVESSFSSVHAFDDYDINIIDFTDDGIWQTLSPSVTKNITSYKELVTICEALKIANSSKTVFLLPGNTNYKYNYKKSGSSNSLGFRSTEQLKNIIPTVIDIISIVQPVFFQLIFSNTNTAINEYTIESDFVFTQVGTFRAVTYSAASRQATTIQSSNSVFTTLKIETSEELEELLRAANLLDRNSTIPEWIDDIECFDDHELKAQIRKHEKVISEHQEQINTINNKLQENNKYKSVLYSNSEELVDVVLDILETMLLCDLSAFEDKKVEDFLFEHEGCYYIGEIKGISSNVKSTNITQLQLHVGSFLNDHPEVELEKIKKLLIINHQRKIPLLQRAPVDEKQIAIASNYNSLIIETSTLLKVFEKYRDGQVSTENCFNMLNQTGLLSL